MRKKAKKKTAPKPVSKRKKAKKTVKVQVVKKPAPKKSEFTAKQIAFCQEYLIDFNATQAAIRAGYSKKTAKEQGYQNSTKLHIQKELRKLIDKREIRTQTKADDVLLEVSRIGGVNMVGLFNENGTVKKFQDIPENIQRSISGFEVEETFITIDKEQVWTGYLKKIKFWSKDKNNELLMRHHGLFLKDNNQAGETLAEALHKAMQEDE